MSDEKSFISAAPAAPSSNNNGSAAGAAGRTGGGGGAAPAAHPQQKQSFAEDDDDVNTFGAAPAGKVSRHVQELIHSLFIPSNLCTLTARER